MNNEIWKAYSHGMAAALTEGGIHVPAMLLRTYRHLELSDSEVMLLLQLLLFKDEGNVFPTPVELSERSGLTSSKVSELLAKLIKSDFLSIDEYIDQATGVHFERYNWSGWLHQAAELNASQRRESKKSAATAKTAAPLVASTNSNLFSIFEQEFGRLLSPMEYETISGWLDKDRYTEDIIKFALKEAVFAGKLSMRYIDRILIEWARNRVTNVEEARAHTQKFRAGRS